MLDPFGDASSCVIGGHLLGFLKLVFGFSSHRQPTNDKDRQARQKLEIRYRQQPPDPTGREEGDSRVGGLTLKLVVVYKVLL